MTGLAGEVAKQVERGVEERSADPHFVRLRDFLALMRSQGLLMHKQYDLPPIDTIGRTAFTATEEA